jgi:5'-methylthioadenosine phosphorylase
MNPFSSPAIAIIGGSGLYDWEGLENRRVAELETPFGAPSAPLVAGTWQGRDLVFLARHGLGHRIAPHEINHRANLYALRSLNVRWVIAVTAVGSLREEYAPRDVVIPDQLFDRTSRRREHTFFGNGIVAHVAFAEPYSQGLRQILLQSARAAGCRTHDGGTYVNMDGPAFSTRAESHVNRQLGFDVIGMTNLAEAKLAREAEMALATLAFITDYDAWKVEEEPVSAEMVASHLHANVDSAKKILSKALPQIPMNSDWPEHSSLDHSIVTGQEHWNPVAVEKLRPILDRFL